MAIGFSAPAVLLNFLVFEISKLTVVRWTHGHIYPKSLLINSIPYSSCCSYRCLSWVPLTNLWYSCPAQNTPRLALCWTLEMTSTWREALPSMSSLLYWPNSVLTAFFQKCQGCDHSNVCHSGVGLDIKLFLVGPAPCTHSRRIYALGHHYTALAVAAERQRGRTRNRWEKATEIGPQNATHEIKIRFVFDGCWL